MSSCPATLDDVRARFSDEWTCADFFATVRWPGGFRCSCGGEGCHLASRPRVWECLACGRQTSVTSGTMFERCRDLPGWLIAVWIMATGGATAAMLQRILGVHSETAWLMFHRIRQALDEIRPPLQGEVTAKIDRMDGESRWVRRFYPTLDPGDGPFVAVAVAGDEVRVEEVERNAGSAILDVVDRWLGTGSTLWLHHAPRYELKRRGIHAPAIPPSEHRRLDVAGDVHLAIRRWLNRLFRGVSRRWLGRYLQERSFRDNRDGNWFDELVSRSLARPPGLVRPPRHLGRAAPAAPPSADPPAP